jgi:uncharacterized protein
VTDGSKFEARLRAWLVADDWRMACLAAVAALGLPDGWIGAGFLRNLAWDRLHGFAAPTPLADVDVIFLDPASGKAREAEIETDLARCLPAAPWSARNQAHMHGRNGDPPYRDTADALEHWLETPTAVAARLTAGGALEILAPLGLVDLFALRVHPTPHARARPDRLAAYRRRMAQKAWPTVWPGVRVEIA